jgi:hypothetical protein
VVATGFGRSDRGIWGLVTRLAAPFLLSPEKGAATTIYLALSPEVETVSGKYFADCKVARPAPEALVMMGVDALKLDRAFKNTGVDEALGRAGWKLHIGAIIGWLVKWFIVLAFLKASLDLVGLVGVSGFLSAIWYYIPQVFIAVLVLVAGTILADFVRKLIAGSAAVANIRSAKMIGSIAYYAIWILALVTALDKLGIFGYFGQILFTGLVVMIALALGLAFGLGGKEVAGKWLARVSSDLSSGHRE